MRRFPLISLLILPLLMVSVDIAIAQEQEYSAKIKTERNKTLITVSVNGITIPDIILDTGFAFDGLMIYNTAYLDSIDTREAHQANIGGAGSGSQAQALILNGSFSTGNLDLQNQAILLLRDDIYKGFPSNGIIGHSLFGHYTTLIDYDREIIKFYHPGSFTPDSTWSYIPLYFKDNNIPWVDLWLTVNEDDNPILLSGYIDLAAGDAILLLEKEEMKYKLPENREKIHIGRGLQGDIYGEMSNIKSVSLDSDIRLCNVRASIARSSVRSKQDNADIIIGNDLLRRFNIIFDYKGERLYYKPNTIFDQPFTE